jgi:hypothetical protein
MLHDLYERGMRPFLAPPGQVEPLPALPLEFRNFTDVYAGTMECRLGAAGGPVDLAWSQFRRDFAIPAELAGKEPWKTMLKLGERWLADEAALRPVACLVYELDQDGASFSADPAIFFNRMKGDAASVTAIYRLTNTLLGRATSLETEAMLRRVVEQLPPASIVLCIGYMLSRPAAQLRFEMTEIEPYRALPDYLRAIGWPGDVRQIDALIAAFPRMARDFHVGLAFDVGATVGPRLGVEFVFKDYSDRAAALDGALDELIAAGLCVPGWRETLATWTGEAPAEPDWMRTFLPRSSDFHRFVSHFKLVLDGPEIAAKCYVDCIPVKMLEASRWGQHVTEAA